MVQSPNPSFFEICVPGLMRHVSTVMGSDTPCCTHSSQSVISRL